MAHPSPSNRENPWHTATVVQCQRFAPSVAKLPIAVEPRRRRVCSSGREFVLVSLVAVAAAGVIARGEVASQELRLAAVSGDLWAEMAALAASP